MWGLMSWQETPSDLGNRRIDRLRAEAISARRAPRRAALVTDSRSISPVALVARVPPTQARQSPDLLIYRPPRHHR
jgi:hypothetical protein